MVPVKKSLTWFNSLVRVTSPSQWVQSVVTVELLPVGGVQEIAYPILRSTQSSISKIAPITISHISDGVDI